MFISLLNSELAPTFSEIEVQSSLRLPSIIITGLPHKELADSRIRVASAIEQSGLKLPKKRYIVNLSPASIQKTGTWSDLPIGLALLSNANRISTNTFKILASGELGLDGSVKPAGFVYRNTSLAVQQGVDALLVPELETKEYSKALHSFEEAKLHSPKVIGVQCLADAFDVVKKVRSNSPLEPIRASLTPDQAKNLELLEVEPSLRRVIEIACAGGHSTLIMGPRGVGKSVAIRWMRAIAPHPAARDWIERKNLEELSLSNTSESSFIREIGPHCRPATLMGRIGLSQIVPGEFTLAHKGILVADEFLEWHRDSIEAIRSPIEDMEVTLSRAHQTVRLPAAFQLIANGNFCPCGGWPRIFPKSSENAPICHCDPIRVEHYLKKIAGPLLDRIDLVYIAGRNETDPQISSQEVLNQSKARVRKARTRLNETHGSSPANLSPATIEKWISKVPIPKGLTSSQNLRTRHRLARNAMTIAALEDRTLPTTQHWAEADSNQHNRAMIFASAERRSEF